eukprot:Gb_30560 [translate_table: standard]
MDKFTMKASQITPNLWKKSSEIRLSARQSPSNKICERKQDDEAESSVQLDMDVPYKSLQKDYGSVSDSPFERQTQPSEIRESTSPSGSARYPNYRVSGPPKDSQQLPQNSHKAAPEKKITLFALRLALLEKSASGLGTLGFIWATVVLLGGFAITLERVDFWFVTIILVIESTRIFSRSHELEWQHEATWSITSFRKDARLVSSRFFSASKDVLRNILRVFCRPFSVGNKASHGRSIREENGRSCVTGKQLYQQRSTHNALKRTWSSANVQLLPYTGWLSISKNVSRLLYWMQLLSASTCVGLSLYRLLKQNYGHIESGELEKKNRNSALNIFYGLSLAEALLFLLEKAYWEWKITAGKLLEEVNTECRLDRHGLHTIRRFFYDAYSQCVNGSVFDGLKMDLVSFSVDLLQSNVSNAQLTGARVLSEFVRNERFAEETLRTMGTMEEVVERLIEMLNWKNHHEQEIRKAAAVIVSRLVRKNRNCLRVAAIAGSLESIASLLYDAKGNDGQLSDDSRKPETLEEYDYSAFSLLGLHILKNLAKDHDNCGKIGSTRGLLTKIIGFTEANKMLLRNSNAADSQIKMVKRSLQLLRMLANTTGLTGKNLREEISKVVFTISNLRDILQYGESRVKLQEVAIDILTSLALEEPGREIIGSTGGVFRHLFSIFFMQRDDGNNDAETKLVSQAGEALALLALENKLNCQRMINVKIDRSGQNHVIGKLTAMLNDPVQGVHAARIIRNLCAYAEADHVELRDVTAAAPKVVKLVMEKQGTYQEAAIGLAAQTFKLLQERAEFDRLFEDAGVSKESVAKQVIEVLEKHPSPSKKVPGIRRFSIELAIGMMQKDEECFRAEKLELEAALEGVLETTSEMENYSTFSVSVGLGRHRVSIYSLVESAMELLRR